MSFNESQRPNWENEMVVENERLKDMKDKIYDMMEDYTEADVGEGNIELVDKELKDITNARLEFRGAIRQYKKKFESLHPSNCAALEGYLEILNQQIRSHANNIWAKVASIKKHQQASVPSQAPPTHAPARHVATTGDLDHKKKIFKDQLLYLTEALTLPDSGSVEDCWRDKSESEVCQAMKELTRWQTSLEKLSGSFRDYEKLSKQLGENSEEFESNHDDFEYIRDKLKEVSMVLRQEDESRNLQSLMPSKADKVKYPSFSGEPGDDFVKFKEKMLECYRKNRVPESDQLDKLRENLKGPALKRVPETVKKLNIAWQNLSEAYGSPMTVLKERLKLFTKLGSVPPDSCPGKQITWYLEFESVLQDIIDLGSSDDLNMQMGAFGPPVQEQVLRFLSDNPLKKREVAMAGTGKQPKEKMLAYRDKIIAFRRETQLAEVESGTAVQEKKKSQQVSHANAAVPQPIRNDDCKICKQIQEQGNPHQLHLFEEHMGIYTNQCPVFMKMKLKERAKLIQKAKLCPFCLDHRVETDRDHEKDCKTKTPRFSERWKCDSPGCSKHSWICQTHAENSNKKKLKLFGEKLSKKGLDFSYNSITDIAGASQHQVRTAVEELEQQVNKELIPVPDGQPMFLFYGAKGKTRTLMVFFDSGCSRFILRDCIPGQELPASCLRKGKIPIGGIGSTTVYAEGEYLVAMETVDGRAQQMAGLAVKTITTDFPDLDITAAAEEVKNATPRNKGWDIQKCKFPPSIGGTVDCLIGIQYNQLQPRLIHMLPSGLAIYKTKLAPHTKGFNYVLGGPHSSFDTWLSQYGNQNHLMLENFVAGLANWRNLGPPSLTQYIMSEQEMSMATEKNMLDDELDSYRELVEFEQAEKTMISKEILDRLAVIENQDVYDEEIVTDGVKAALNSECNLSSFHSNQTGTEFTSPTGKYESIATEGKFTISAGKSEATAITRQVDFCHDCGEELLEDHVALYEDEKISRLKHLLDSHETGVEITYRCIRCRNC